MQLSAAAVLKVLASPGKYHFKPGIWYGINTPQTFVDAAQAHTLAGRLGLNQSELMGYLTELGLGTMRLTTWKKVIESMGLKIFMQKTNIGTQANVAFIAFQAEPLFSPKDQCRPQSLLAQPSPYSKTLSAVEQLKRPRAASPPQQQQRRRTEQSATSAGAGSSGTPTEQQEQQEQPSRLSLGDILGRLGFARPFRDSAGESLRPALASKKFGTSYAESCRRRAATLGSKILAARLG
jgi:hypothetical protein